MHLQRARVWTYGRFFSSFLVTPCRTCRTLNSTFSSLLHEAFVFVCNTFAVMHYRQHTILIKTASTIYTWPQKLAKIFYAWTLTNTDRFSKQEAFEKYWAHSPLRAAARRLFYIAIHHVSLLSHAATVARCLRIDVHNNDDNNNNAWQWGPLWPAP